MYALNICGTIRVIVGNDEDAQEICQDVFVKVWDRADTYSGSKGRFFTWLLKIARNAAIDRLGSKDFKNSKKNISLSQNSFKNARSVYVRIRCIPFCRDIPTARGNHPPF